MLHICLAFGHYFTLYLACGRAAVAEQTSCRAQRRSRPSPDDRWEEYSVVVAAPKRATPEPAPADAQPSSVSAAEADDRTPKAAQRNGADERQAPEQPALEATAASVDRAADGEKAGPSAADSGIAPRAASPGINDSRQRASEPPAQSAAEAPVADRSAALLPHCVCHVILSVSVVLPIAVVSYMSRIRGQCDFVSVRSTL